MNEEREKYLKEKYLEGKTSLSEEIELKELHAMGNQDKEPWFQYLGNEKINKPSNLAEELWKKSPINKAKNNFKRKFLIGFISLATLFLLGAHYFKSQVDDEYEYKKQLLEEAIKFANNGIESEKKDIFYKDDLITIYVTN